MTIQEKRNLCSRALISWSMKEEDNKDFSIHDEEIAELFISQVLLKKFDVFKIDIILPDELLMILAICTNGNPGQTQVVLKDLLNNIKTKKGPIPNGYTVRSLDFALAFCSEYPIMEIPEINAKYESLWDAQKTTQKTGFGSDNLCDTVEWWKEVMK